MPPPHDDAGGRGRRQLLLRLRHQLQRRQLRLLQEDGGGGDQGGPQVPPTRSAEAGGAAPGPGAQEGAGQDAVGPAGGDQLRGRDAGDGRPDVREPAMVQPRGGGTVLRGARPRRGRQHGPAGGRGEEECGLHRRHDQRRHRHPAAALHLPRRDGRRLGHGGRPCPRAGEAPDGRRRHLRLPHAPQLLEGRGREDRGHQDHRQDGAQDGGPLPQTGDAAGAAAAPQPAAPGTGAGHGVGCGDASAGTSSCSIGSAASARRWSLW